MQERPDLFGQVVVTWPEIVDWVARVAGITPDSPRWLPYVRSWNVADKIAAAKLAGAWPVEGRATVTAAAHRPIAP